MQTVQFLFLSRFPRPTVSCSIMQGSWSTCAATTNKKCIFNIDLDFLPGWPLGFGRLLTTVFFLTILPTNYRFFDTLLTFLFSGYMAYLCTQLSGDFKNRWRGLTLNIYFKCCSLWQACIILRLQWKLQIQSIQSPFFNPFSFLRHLPPLFGCLALFFAISITTTTTADHSSLFSHFWLNLK